VDEYNAGCRYVHGVGATKGLSCYSQITDHQLTNLKYIHQARSQGSITIEPVFSVCYDKEMIIGFCII